MGALFTWNCFIFVLIALYLNIELKTLISAGLLMEQFFIFSAIKCTEQAKAKICWFQHTVISKLNNLIF